MVTVEFENHVQDSVHERIAAHTTKSVGRLIAGIAKLNTLDFPDTDSQSSARRGLVILSMIGDGGIGPLLTVITVCDHMRLSLSNSEMQFAIAVGIGSTHFTLAETWARYRQYLPDPCVTYINDELSKRQDWVRAVVTGQILETEGLKTDCFDYAQSIRDITAISRFGVSEADVSYAVDIMVTNFRIIF